MNRTNRLSGKLGIMLCGALLGCATYGQPSVSVAVSVPLPSVEIRAASDFYEPLTPYGRWEVVGSYGRCWIPGGIEADWRPYSEGYWQLTDNGWYWTSDEPWGWATYHYGRWNLSADFGWYWVPQTQWAPAWVSWHSGGGYIGWAPLYPSGVTVISPQAYVFVGEGHFMDPVRRSSLVANNTTIINQTVVKEAPATAAIEKASGRKLQAVPVQELRQKAEAPVVAKQRAPTAAGEKTAQPAARNEVQPAEKKAVAAREPAPVQQPAAPAKEPAAPAAKNSIAQSETRKSAPAAAEAKPVASKEPPGQNASKQEKSAPPAEKNAPAREMSAPSERSGVNPSDKDQEKKGRE
jgi:hypothetical protein